MDNRIRVVLFIVLLFGVSMISDFFNNAWCLLTGRGFVIPKASSIFTFRATLMNQGSGEWWVYGEDGNFFYYFTGEGETPYLKIAKVESSKCSAFAPLNIATWCSIKY
jgi:hypothetical protein